MEESFPFPFPSIFLQMCVVYCCFVVKVRIMKKRLIRKTFDMIEDIGNRENKEVYWRKLLKLSLKNLKTHGIVGRFSPLTIHNG